MTGTPEDRDVLPLTTRLELVHALVERVAARIGCRVLHVKGPPAATQLGLEGRRPVDVDVWVAPADAERLVAALDEAGWTSVEAGRSTALYRHALVVEHALWGCSIDVHHRMPGVGLDAAKAFELAWADRVSLLVAGRPLPVPEPGLQGLLVLLHAARSRGSVRAADDVRQVRAQLEATPSGLLAWADRLHCAPEMLAALPWWPGRDGPAAPRSPSPALDLWRGRLREAGSPGRRLRLAWAALLPDRTVMSRRAGHPLGRVALVLAWVRRWAAGVAAVRPCGRDAVPWPEPPAVPGPVPGATTPDVVAAPSPLPAAVHEQWAWCALGATTYVADLDTARVVALNAAAALVWHESRSIARRHHPVPDPFVRDALVVARVRALVAAPRPELGTEVRRTLGELRACGLLDGAAGS